MDEIRFADLRQKLLSLEMRSSVMLVALSQSIGPLQASMDFRAKLKEHVCILIDGAIKSNAELEAAMPSVSSQVTQDIKQGLKDQDLPPLSDELVKLIQAQLMDLINPGSRVRQIIRKDFFFSQFLVLFY